MLKSEDNRPGAPSGAPHKALVWCRANGQNSMCRQTLGEPREPRTNVRFILPSCGRAGSAAWTWVQADCRHAAERVSDVRSHRQTLALGLQVGRLLDYRSNNGRTVVTWPVRGCSAS